jgi:hypothetical protein
MLMIYEILAAAKKVFRGMSINGRFGRDVIE